MPKDSVDDTGNASVGMKLEVVVIPVSDVTRAKESTRGSYGVSTLICPRPAPVPLDSVHAARLRLLSAIGAGLYSLGIPKDSIVTYETATKAGEYLVIPRGTSAEVAKAKDILNKLKSTKVTDNVLEPAMQPAAR